MEEIRWGIIGCGDVTEVKSGPAFNKVPHSKLVAVMRRNCEKAADYARRHSVPKWYTDAQALIEDEEVNAIYIATPPDSHEMYALAALAAGKPVYVEKPMALNATAAQNIMEAADQHNVKLSVAHYRRQQPYYKKIKELLDSKSIGDVLWVNLRFLQPHKKVALGINNPWRIDPAKSGGGLFHDLAPHQLDLMVFFFGAPQEAKGIAYNKGGHYQADDVVSGTALLSNEILFNGFWHFDAPPHAATDVCEIIGTKGRLLFSVFGPQVVHLTVEDKSETLNFEPPQHVQQPMIEQVAAYFRGQAENPCSAADGVQVMQWMEAFTKK
mgnify:CR=1 FL=1